MLKLMNCIRLIIRSAAACSRHIAPESVLASLEDDSAPDGKAQRYGQALYFNLLTLLIQLSYPVDAVLDGIILQPQLQSRLQAITIATARARQYKADFRNFMLYGPPGTGKTMFAKRLAYQSGLDYAVLAGGDVGPLGRDAVQEIHRVFDWAKTSRRG